MKLFGKENAFYNGQIKKYTALFGSLFSDLHITRGEDTISVPIRYANGTIKNKGENGELNSQFRAGISLPAMSFELVNIAPDNIRKTGQYIPVKARGVLESNAASINHSFSPVPHNLSYALTVRTKTLEDAFQILEQIVATFNPQVTVEYIDMKDLQVTRDITIRLEDSAYDFTDNYMDTQDETRQIEITLQFTLMGYLYKKTEVGRLVLHAELIGILDGETLSFGSIAASPEEVKSLEDNAQIGMAHKGFSDFAKKTSKG